jgi:hypothetical protein
MTPMIIQEILEIISFNGPEGFWGMRRKGFIFRPFVKGGLEENFITIDTMNELIH